MGDRDISVIVWKLPIINVRTARTSTKIRTLYKWCRLTLIFPNADVIRLHMTYDTSVESHGPQKIRLIKFVFVAGHSEPTIVPVAPGFYHMNANKWNKKVINFPGENPTSIIWISLECILCRFIRNELTVWSAVFSALNDCRSPPPHLVTRNRWLIQRDYTSARTETDSHKINSSSHLNRLFKSLV